MDQGDQPRVWLKAFWGFGPEEDGYLGFTKPGDQQRFLDEARQGDLVLIYGADTSETDRDDRRQALGFLEIDPTPIRDIDAMSDYGRRRKIDQGAAHRWTHAVPVLRAWEVQRKIEIQHVASETWAPNRARVIASRGELMTAADTSRALALPVRAASVFGREPVPADPEETDLRSAFAPSRGLTPTFGSREASYEDGEHYLYFLIADGDAGALLGRDKTRMHNKVLVKVGFSNDPKRRCAELNAALPPASVLKWRLEMTSKPYRSGAAAKSAEDILKDALAARHESLGGEFFLGTKDGMLGTFFGVPGVGYRIEGAPSRKMAT